MRSWQRDILHGIYDTPTRRAIVSFGRKNAKTSLAAMLLLLHLVGPEAIANSQLNSAAQSREQAAILFALAAKMVRMNPDLSQFVTIRDTAKQLFCPELGTLYKALSADASTAYGLSPIFTVHDELGQVRGPRSELYDALETASGAHDRPLSIIISTQSPDAADLLSMLIDDAKSGADQETKLFLYAAPEEADPFDEATIMLANPAYGDFLNKDEVLRQAETAKRMPSAEASFRNLILNQRIEAHNPFVSRSVWDSCGGAIDSGVFERNESFMGLDLSARSDLTALVQIAREDDRWHVRPVFFCPMDGLIERSARDRAPYDVWYRKGQLVATPGKSVGYDSVADTLVHLCDTGNVIGVAYDRWRMDILKTELAKMGAELPLVDYGQGFRDMSPALDELEEELVQGRVRHGDHPILRWCASNAVVQTDPAGNRKLNKARSTGRIDGMVALAMAMGIAHKVQESQIIDLPQGYTVAVG